MKEYEKGIISEKALEDVASGANIDKIKLRNALISAGVVISAATSIGVPWGIAEYKLKHPEK